MEKNMTNSSDNSKPKRPPIPKDADLRSFQWMQLDIIALLNSETWAVAKHIPDASRACINLWIKAFHQVPAGSLPNNDAILADYADVQDWASVREIALRGWYLATDDRLYHDGVKKCVTRSLKKQTSGKEAATHRWKSKRKPKKNNDKLDNTNAMPTQCEPNAKDRTGQDNTGESRTGTNTRTKNHRLNNTHTSAAGIFENGEGGYGMDQDIACKPDLASYSSVEENSGTTTQKKPNGDVRALKSVQHTKLLLNSRTLEKAREIAPGYDIYYLHQSWLDWVASKDEPPRSPDRAFLGFVRKHVEENPL